MNKTMTIVLAAGIAVALCCGISADSLWSKEKLEKGSNNSLTADKRAFKEGDQVVILIVESAQASQSASTKTQKDASVSAGIGGNLAAPFTTAGNGTYFGGGANERSNGAGNNKRQGMIRAKIAVNITRVLKNGNLEIQGSRLVTINDEKENIEVSGTIRPEDVTADNTVLSSAIADAQIKYEGKGPLGDKVKVGILSRILDWLWIF